MSKKKRGKQKSRSAFPSKAKGNRAQRIIVMVLLAGIVTAGFGVLLSSQQNGQPTSQDSVSEEVFTGVEADNSATGSTSSIEEETSAIDDAVVAKVEANVLEVVEEESAENVVVDLPIAPEVGARAPDFELATITGEQLALAHTTGKPMFISFFHSW